MPEIGDIASAKSVGKNGRDHYMYSACADCGVKRWLIVRNGKTTRSRCRSCALKKYDHSGSLHPNWKGGRARTSQGYVLIKLNPSDFFYEMANTHGYVMEHRLVVAKALGRKLHPWETVYHLNGVKDDNRYPDNLQLTSTDYHNQLTRMEARIEILEQKAVEQQKLIKLLRYQVKYGENRPVQT